MSLSLQVHSTFLYSICAYYIYIYLPLSISSPLHFPFFAVQDVSLATLPNGVLDTDD
jgi:hypothetical protein